MSPTNQTELVATARSMRQQALAPYSNYHVGAAVETEDGTIIGGCNVESSSYSLTCCAERVALFRAVAEGHKTFRALAVATENGGTPCGACRQVIWDLCGDISIYVADDNGTILTYQSHELLPEAFSSDRLK